MNTPERTWGRVSSRISKSWQVNNPSADFLGHDKGISPTDCACDRNLQAGVAIELEESSIAAMLDACKGDERVKDSMFLEARALKFDLRLLWMLLQVYQMPRRLKAHGSLS
eukprot:3975608-Pyramimonas_sp.AAC.2